MVWRDEEELMRAHSIRIIPPAGGSHWGALCRLGTMQFFEHGPTVKQAVWRLKQAVEASGGIWPEKKKARQNIERKERRRR